MSIGELTGTVALILAVVAITALAWRGTLEDRKRPRKLRPPEGSRQAVPVPIIIIEAGSVDLYESVEAAARSCEAIDVWNRVYVAYDARGRALWLQVDERDGVWMEPDPDASAEVEKVSEHLRRHIASCRCEEDLGELSLPELLEKARTLGLVEGF